MKEYVTIAQRVEDDFFERKSQFIGYIAPVSSEEEALAFSRGNPRKTPRRTT